VDEGTESDALDDAADLDGPALHLPHSAPATGIYARPAARGFAIRCTRRDAKPSHSGLLAGGAILAEAGLSFLGLGDPAVLSWGAQLGSAQRFVREAWWMSVFPGLAVTLTVLACNVMADAAGERSFTLERRAPQPEGRRLAASRVPGGSP
jgi:hypothetical protein